MHLMEQFGVNMLEKAQNADPVIGREAEIESIVEVLCRKHKNNPASAAPIASHCRTVYCL